MGHILIFLFLLVSVLNGGENLVAEVILSFFLPFFFLREFLPGKNPFFRSPYNLLLLLFLAFGFVSSVFTSSCFGKSFFSFFRIINYLLFYFLALTYLRQDESFQKKFLYVLVLLGIFFSSLGLVQFFQGKAIVANLPNRNFLAGFLLVPMSILLSRLFWEVHLSDKEKIVNILFVFLMFFVLFFTHSRGGILSLIVVITLLLAIKYRPKLVLISSILLILLILIFFPENYISNFLKVEDPYAFTRLKIWKAAFFALLKKPLFGWGLGTFENVFFRYNFPVSGMIARFGKYPGFVLNEYLQIAVELGLLAFFIFLGLLYFFFKELVYSIRNLLRNEGVIPWELSAVFLGSTAILTHSLVDFNLHLPLLALTLTFFFAFATKEKIIELYLSQKLKIFCYAKLMELLVLLRRNILRQNNSSEAKEAFSLLLRRRIVILALLLLLVFFNGSRFLSQYYFRKAGKLKSVQEINNIYKKAARFNPFESRVYQGWGDFSAQMYISTGKREWKELAISRYRRAIELDPENPFIYRSLGGFLGDYTEQKETSIKYYEKAIEKNPYNAFFYFELSTLSQKRGVINKAIEYLQQARKLEPNFLRTYYEEGLLLEKIGEEEKALSLYKKILEIKNKYPASAEGYEKQLLSLDYPSFYNQLAGLYFRRKEYAQAITYCQQALLLDPGNRILKENLRLSLQKSGLHKIQPLITPIKKPDDTD